MTLDELHALADKFFEWPEGSGRQTVTTFSALLFAQHVLEMHEKSLEMHEKSLGTENNAGVDALRDAAQQALESNSLAGILLREHDNVEQAINYAERMAQRYANFKSLMAMEYQDAAEELKAWKQAHGIGEGE